jgi:hypothetical protein
MHRENEKESERERDRVRVCVCTHDEHHRIRRVSAGRQQGRQKRGWSRSSRARARFRLLGSKHIATKLPRACNKFFKVSDLDYLLYKANMELTSEN